MKICPLHWAPGALYGQVRGEAPHCGGLEIRHTHRLTFSRSMNAIRVHSSNRRQGPSEVVLILGKSGNLGERQGVSPTCLRAMQLRNVIAVDTPDEHQDLSETCTRVFCLSCIIRIKSHVIVAKIAGPELTRCLTQRELQSDRNVSIRLHVR